MNDMQRMKRVLSSARAGFEPTSADRERVRRRLFAAAASGVAGSLVAGGAAGSTAGAGVSSSLLVGSIKLFAGTLVVVVAGGAAVLTAGSEAPPAQRGAAPSSVSSSSHVGGSRPAGPGVSLGDAATIPEPATEGARVDALSRREPRSETRRDRGAAALQPENRDLSRAPSSSELGRELALLKEARAATAEHRAGAALSVLDALDRQFPGGSLLEERAALRVVANCESGAGERERAVNGFAARFPRSVYLPRLRRECALKAEIAPSATAGATRGFEDE